MVSSTRSIIVAKPALPVSTWLTAYCTASRVRASSRTNSSRKVITLPAARPSSMMG